MQLTKEIAIAEAEKRAINETLTDELKGNCDKTRATKPIRVNIYPNLCAPSRTGNHRNKTKGHASLRSR